jgi:hypothetical protein
VIVRINITARDIREGQRYNSFACPVARACHRAGFPNASVGPGFWRPHGGERQPLPERVVAFVRAFDTNAPVGPFRAALAAKGKE